MPDHYVGEIRLFGGNYAPPGWALCHGQSLEVSQYGALFSLIGTTYGGDGRISFKLPDLRGRLVCGTGQGTGLSDYAMGQTVGTGTVALTEPQLPPHAHTMIASTVAATAATPSGNVYAACTDGYATYVAAGAPGNTEKDPNPGMLAVSGGGGDHANIMPCLAMNYIIALDGLYPATA